jgi:hypothetical protein
VGQDSLVGTGSGVAGIPLGLGEGALTVGEALGVADALMGAFLLAWLAWLAWLASVAAEAAPQPASSATPATVPKVQVAVTRVRRVVKFICSSSN